MPSAAAKMTFKSQTAKDFAWPYSKPLREMAEVPPLRTEVRNYYLARKSPEECLCEDHGCEANAYDVLAKKEAKLLHQVRNVRRQMVTAANRAMDAPYGVTQHGTASTYQSDFNKRDWISDSYRKLMPEVDCEDCPPPLCKETRRLKNGYRDPYRFRLVPHCLPGIDTASPVSLAVTPENTNYYLKGWPGRSEYQDTYSRQAAAIIKSSQQYREPQPSSRRRCADPNI